ncbi:MAG: tRNA lysidine(34) synthetase TilS [Deltaproteobacteria bacterium]|nr:tRNA lysidine(34) synthetase TilS [Candidatus Zymogenaceae bacterium]
MKQDVINIVRESIDSHGMLVPGDVVITAISGGADSTALLTILTHLQEEYDIRVEAAHVNHGLRGAESKRDEKHAVALARFLGLNVHVTHVNVKEIARRDGISIQEAGRNVRNAFFRKTLEFSGASKIATGHTRDDNVETFLMRLVTGSGPQGLSGISPYDPPYTRPLIDVTRYEIEDFLRKRGIPWVEDSSNISPTYTRNRIRSEIIPALLKINPGAQENIAGAIGRLRKMYESVDVKAEARVRPGVTLSIGEVDELPDGIKKEVVKKLIYSAQGYRKKPLRIGDTHINAVCRLISGPSRGERSIDLPGGLKAVRTYNNLTITSGGPECDPKGTVQIAVPGRTALDGWKATITAEFLERERDTHERQESSPDGPDSRIARGSDFAYLDADLLSAPLSVRARLPGDRISPGGGGGSKKIKDYFIDRKIERSQRDSIPIVACGETPVWVVGFTVDRRFHVTEKTERIIKLTFISTDP